MAASIVATPQDTASLPTRATRVPAPALPGQRISRNARAVVATLREAGHHAYLVGGCVRDLLLGRAPKDFDVATDAHPEAICALFPRSRPIGRRFRIVHVRMRGEVIEVSTFRSAVEAAAAPAETTPAAAEGANAHVAANGVILRDNAYGTLDEDAFRRDFTVNALYYDPQDDVLLDYCDGMADIASGTLRLIGDPATRLREDPVRILRAARFAAKLDLRMAAETEAAIAPAGALLAEVPVARLFDEFGKLFLTGHGAETFALLERYGLDGALFALPEPIGAVFRKALANSDRRVRQGKPVTEAFLLAALLWSSYRERLREAASLPRGQRAQAISLVPNACFAALRQTIAPPRRHTYFVRDVWELQGLLERRTPKGVPAALAHRRFRAAYDFLLLRAQTGEVPTALADWWTQAQSWTPQQLREQLGAVAAREEEPSDLPIAEAPGNDATPTRRRRRRRYGRGRRRSRAASPPANPEERTEGSATVNPRHAAQANGGSARTPL